ncbi:MAG: uncharacterized protein K0R39_3449 [Symbiobacteriaceae bacterium]|jgi:pimeloyl-ACP methyl ester carboxylesterase|nr:uncharacterized protein [Symbiobacteriaceae bacterium]
MRMRLPRSLRTISLAVVALAALGFVYQPLATAIDSRRYPPPGRLVDMGGYRLHILCEGIGGPTVVLEAGLGGSSLDWSLVAPALTREARVCTYDRAGYGWSEPGPAPRTGARGAEELHTLLIRAGEPGPYILAAQGLGGVYARAFAAAYPRETAGLVLVDPPADGATVTAAAPGGSGAKLLARLSVHRVLAAADSLSRDADDVAAKLPQHLRPAYRAVTSTSRHFDTIAAETAALAESRKADRATSLPPDLPLLLLLPATARGGAAHLDRPAEVLDAIRTVRNDARRGARLH